MFSDAQSLILLSLIGVWDCFENEIYRVDI